MREVGTVVFVPKLAAIDLMADVFYFDLKKPNPCFFLKIPQKSGFFETKENKAKCMVTQK